MSTRKSFSYFGLVLILLVPATGTALEFDIYNYVRYNWQGLNQGSPYNRDNIHHFHASELFAKSSLTFTSDWGRATSARLTLEGQYRPVMYDPLNLYNVPDYERDDAQFFVKELFFDVVADRFNLRFGKQHITMGQGAFFNPLDVINKTRDLLMPIEDAEGNPLVLLNIPITNQLFVDLIAVFEIEDPESRLNEDDFNIWNVPFIIKANYSMLDFSTFGFVRLQEGDDPIVGASFANSFALSDDLSSTLYGELTFKGASTRYRNLRNDGYMDRPRIVADQYYLAFLLGHTLRATLPGFRLMDGLDWYIEYYYDLENWSEDEFVYYLEWLDDIYENQIYSLHFSALQYKEDFRNSHSYLFNSLVGRNVAGLRDLDIGLDTILNVGDLSSIMAPHLTYNFGDQDFEFRVQGFFFLDSFTLDGLQFWQDRDVDSYRSMTEFGNELINYRVGISLSYTYSHF